MESSNGFITRKKIEVVVLTKYDLTYNCLKMLVESKNKSIDFVDSVSSTQELLEFVKKTNPDVALFCLAEDELEKVEIIPKLFKVALNTKVIILLPPNSTLDHTKLLKMGVTGIVGSDQREEVLVRAIQQVAEGEVWLNQKVIAQLLDNGVKPSDNNHKQKGLFSNDPLTVREIEVIEEIGKGLTNKEISDQLFISEATVRHHLSSIYGKLQIEDRLNLVIYALQNDILEISSTED